MPARGRRRCMVTRVRVRVTVQIGSLAWDGDERLRA